MDSDLEQNILAYMKSCSHDKALPTSVFLNKFQQYSKQEVTSTLSSMRRRGKIQRGGSQSWFLGQSRKTSPKKTGNSAEKRGGIDKVQVLDILWKRKNAIHQNDVSVHDLVRQMGTNKKQLNRVLYQMQSELLIDRGDSNPPRWFLVDAGVTMCQEMFFTPSQGDDRYSEQFPLPIVEPNNDFNLQTMILNELFSYDKQTVTANELEEIIRSNKTEINRELYALQRNGFLQRSGSDPPAWFLLPDGFEHCKSLNLKQLAGPPQPMIASTSQVFPTTSSNSGFRESPNSISSRSKTWDLEAEDTAPKTAQTDAVPQKGFDEDNLCRQASSMVIVSGGTKNAISQINEYAQVNKHTVDYQFNDKGPSHNKRFIAHLVLGTRKFPPAEGGNKKDAKLKAAEQALQEILSAAAVSTPNQSPTNVEAGSTPFQSSSKNAVSIINEYAQAAKLDIEFECDMHGPDHKKRFTTTLQLNKKVIATEEASSKKDSKQKVAEAAIERLVAEGKMMPCSAEAQIQRTFTCSSMTFHDRVASMVTQKFESLLAQLPDAIVGRKIIAGFVMSHTKQTEYGEERKWTEISVSSGNRCVAGDGLSLKGQTVNDCHAEVIARRGLVRFLYSQLHLYIADPQNNENIFTEWTSKSSKLVLKPGIQFHLYISTAPCGDSALFAKSDMDEMDPNKVTETHHPLFENKRQGVLRTKVENGEGCIPIEADANVPTWDGLLKGERLRTMSCSDKVAKWNFLGLQGALLSQFIEPIYMSSLTLGTLYHHGHLTRAICCRLQKYIEEIQPPVDVPLPYKVNHPSVAKISGEDPGRDTGKVKTREFSLNWSIGDEFPEVLDGTKGRCEERFGCPDPISQVCKANLFNHYKQIKGKDISSSYTQAKKLSEDYQNAKQVMKDIFYKSGCGHWMDKPIEQDQFT